MRRLRVQFLSGAPKIKGLQICEPFYFQAVLHRCYGFGKIWLRFFPYQIRRIYGIGVRTAHKKPVSPDGLQVVFTRPLRRL